MIFKSHTHSIKPKANDFIKVEKITTWSVK